MHGEGVRPGWIGQHVYNQMYEGADPMQVVTSRMGSIELARRQPCASLANSPMRAGILLQKLLSDEAQGELASGKWRKHMLQLRGCMMHQAAREAVLRHLATMLAQGVAGDLPEAKIEQCMLVLELAASCPGPSLEAGLVPQICESLQSFIDAPAAETVVLRAKMLASELRVIASKKPSLPTSSTLASRPRPQGAVASQGPRASESGRTVAQVMEEYSQEHFPEIGPAVSDDGRPEAEIESLTAMQAVEAWGTAGFFGAADMTGSGTQEVTKTLAEVMKDWGRENFPGTEPAAAGDDQREDCEGAPDAACGGGQEYLPGTRVGASGDSLEENGRIVVEGMEEVDEEHYPDTAGAQHDAAPVRAQKAEETEEEQGEAMAGEMEEATKEVCGSRERAPRISKESARTFRDSELASEPADSRRSEDYFEGADWEWEERKAEELAQKQKEIEKLQKQLEAIKATGGRSSRGDDQQGAGEGEASGREAGQAALQINTSRTSAASSSSDDDLDWVGTPPQLTRRRLRNWLSARRQLDDSDVEVNGPVPAPSDAADDGDCAANTTDQPSTTGGPPDTSASNVAIWQWMKLNSATWARDNAGTDGAGFAGTEHAKAEQEPGADSDADAAVASSTVQASSPGSLPPFVAAGYH
ncbi:hypothetical protein CYMTET_32950 [Cymbomonas tetramitiformis]|uniref:Uncharacterized protein n=1 Tax=Cymbomonas tetramitiformis TaxID=36881 RepID=A0AAE0FEN3_9CHLO|nr:hypothetical protein CYMTET_32950 [Cymbomonas tetramitiformis]